MTIEEARQDWTQVRPAYEDFALYLKQEMEGIAKSLGIFSEVSARAKETHSLVKKLITKTHLTYETLPDKVGVRIVVRYRGELKPFLAQIEGRFSHGAIDDKADKLGSDRVGYQSIHIDGLALLSDDARFERFHPTRFFGELQLRTLSQHLWSEISHDTFYKNDSTVLLIPEDLKRRVNLTAGLIEMADREFDRMSREVQPDARAEMFTGLEKLYYSIATEKPNVELSLAVIDLLLPLYGSKTVRDILNELVVPIFERDRSALAKIYGNPDNREHASAFLYQPEALLLYQRLLYDRDQILATWNEHFPESELIKFAVAVGISLD